MSGTILVFGGTGAIWLAISRKLASAGAELVIADLGDRARFLDELPGSGHNYAPCDVGDLESVRSVVSQFGERITGVVSAVGINYTGPVVSTDWNAYDRMQRVNLKGAFHIAAACEELAQPESYVFLASVAGLKGEAGGSVYCSTKFGLIGFVQSFAAEIAGRGARANSVCPGNVDSPLLRDLAAAVAEREGTTPEQMLRQLAGDSAFERLITVEEVAEVVAFLTSRSSSGMSGQSLVVDGPPN